MPISGLLNKKSLKKYILKCLEVYVYYIYVCLIYSHLWEDKIIMSLIYSILYKNLFTIKLSAIILFLNRRWVC
jgi:hypothetical protein